MQSEMWGYLDREASGLAKVENGVVMGCAFRTEKSVYECLFDVHGSQRISMLRSKGMSSMRNLLKRIRDTFNFAALEHQSQLFQSIDLKKRLDLIDRFTMR